MSLRAGYPEGYEPYQPEFIKYEPVQGERVRFQFLQNVKATHFCDSLHVQVHQEGDVLAEKVIELFVNPETERIFTVIDRTRLHIGTLEESVEYSDYDQAITGQRFLRTKKVCTVYILSDGFGKKFKALPDHLAVIE